VTDPHLSPAAFGAAFKAFMEAVVEAAAPPASPLLDRVRDHLGADPSTLAVVAEEFDTFEQPTVQVALDALLTAPGTSAELVGVGAEHKHYMGLGLSDLLGRTGHGRSALVEGPVDYVNYHLTGGQTLPCVQFGLSLVRRGEVRLAVFVAGPTDHGPRHKLRVEAMAAQPEAARAFLADLVVEAERRNVYRGHVISLSPGELGMGPQSLVAFHDLPAIGQADVILPPGVLERIERHTVVFATQAARLKAAGRSLKRGLLLHGPPGTGKTLTIMYLAGQMPGRTVILTTGLGMGLLHPVVGMARALAPAMVVLEDVDLIAEERGSAWGRNGPLLFELLNELDGLQDDCDVIFALTTNRPEILEPALAARPGRIDLAVELPLPDAGGRRRLLELYARGLTLAGVDLDAVVEGTKGASPAFIKELLRKAALLAAEATPADGTDGPAALTVTQDHLATALAELAEGRELSRSILGFQSERAPRRRSSPVAP
jgi:hypothetical protein